MKALLKRISFFVFFSLSASFSIKAGALPISGTALDLSSRPEFIEADYTRELIYISLPQSNKLLIVSLETLQEIETIEFSGQPTGLDISDDGETLYVAISEQGVVAAVDLDNQFNYTEINLFGTSSLELVVNDLIEISGERLFVAYREGANNRGLLQVDLLDPNKPVTRVGLDTRTNQVRRFDSDARLGTNPARTYLFLQQLNGFFKLDLTQPLLPILSDGYVDPSGSPIAQYSGVGKDFDISNDGTLIYTDFGQVIRTSDLKPIVDLDLIKVTQSFQSALSSDNKEVFLVEDDMIRVVDTNGRYVIAQAEAPCAAAFNTNREIEIDYVIEAEGGRGLYLALSVFSGITDFFFKLCYFEKTEAMYEGFPKAGQSFDPVSYFPLIRGMKLPYSNDGSERIAFVTTIARSNTFIRGKAARLLSNEVGTQEFYSSDSNGVFLHRGKGDNVTLDYLPAIPVTTPSGPVLTRISYSGFLDSSLGDFDLGVSVVLRDFELLELPSGETVEAYKFLQSQNFRRNGQFISAITNKIWFAKKFGFVKVITNAYAFDINDRGLAQLISIKDKDNDNIIDLIDNCPISNFNQADFDGDTIGDACDTDDDNDGIPDTYELANGLNPKNASDANADSDGDGFTNRQEFEFGSDPQVFDFDLNENGVPDSVDKRRSSVPPIIQLLLED